MKTRIAVLGATGFTGEKLVEILLRHRKVELTYLTSRTKESIAFSDIFPRYKKLSGLVCKRLDLKEAEKSADFFFLALPHTVSMEVAGELLKKDKKIVDLSADYRLKDTRAYRKYYKKVHQDKNNLKKAVYGLVEFFKEEIKEACLIANPGCYAISIILGLAPLLKEDLICPCITVDAKSSVTGAGRKALWEYHFSNIANNLWAYKPFSHQHIPEIIQILKGISSFKEIEIDFLPHIVDVEKGIYSTIYLRFKKVVSKKLLRDVFHKYYSKAVFVRLHSFLPRLKDVVDTNFCDLGWAVSKDGKRGVVVACIDNLIKGAAGNAVQNMNIMLGYDEEEGLW